LSNIVNGVGFIMLCVMSQVFLVCGIQMHLSDYMITAGYVEISMTFSSSRDRLC
jgi:hypothetical protein